MRRTKGKLDLGDGSKLVDLEDEEDEKDDLPLKEQGEGEEEKNNGNEDGDDEVKECSPQPIEKEESAEEDAAETNDSTDEKKKTPAKRGRKRKAGKSSGKKTDDGPPKKKGRPKKSGARKATKSKKKAESEDEEESAGEEVYEVEKIVDSRKKGGVLQYLIRWKGYTKADDTWEAESSLDCPDKIQEFKKQSSNGKNKSPVKKGKVKKGKGKKKAAAASSDEDGSEVEAEYEVQKIVEVHTKKNGEREFLVRWKGYSAEDDTWEAESKLSCPELLKAFLSKVDKAKQSSPHETRVNRKATDRFTVNAGGGGRKLSSRFKGPRRTYVES